MAQSKKKIKYATAGFKIEEGRLEKLKQLARDKSSEEKKDITVTSLLDSAVLTSYGI